MSSSEISWRNTSPHCNDLARSRVGTTVESVQETNGSKGSIKILKLRT